MTVPPLQEKNARTGHPLFFFLSHNETEGSPSPVLVQQDWFGSELNFTACHFCRGFLERGVVAE